MRLLKLVPDNTNIDFMRARTIALILSVLAVVGSLTLLGFKGLNLGIDFVGGQMVRAEFAQSVEVDQLRDRVAALDLGDAHIQEVGSDRSYQIRLPTPPGPPTAAAAAVTELREMLQTQYPGTRVDAGESVSGKVSEELAWDGALAITLGTLAVAIYIWFRFEWHFGVGGLLTLFHDVSVMLGFFALTQLQVDLNIVAGFLALVGYSLNDTVVIYDRIRENLRKFRKMAIIPLINVSLNETLSRTVATSVSLLLALGMLLALGPDTLLNLTLMMFVSTLLGTYSSVYISAPVLVWLGLQPDSFIQKESPDTSGPQPAA